MPDTKVKCYSYIRWSSEKQSKGTTLERQLRTAKEIADENGLELVELIDKGISAFKGKNIHAGALGAFIKAVEKKKIPANSWLVVENLDRISREDILKAQGLFLEMLSLGVTIVTGMDKKVYSEKTVTKNPMDLMYRSCCLLEHMRNHGPNQSVLTVMRWLSLNVTKLVSEVPRVMPMRLSL